MVSVDTNVLVRLVTLDDAGQVEAARTLIEEHRVFVPLTVVLETEWVLRFSYGFTRESVCNSLEQLALDANVTLEAAPVVIDAIRLTRGGLDFADAMHLASSTGVESLATFDEQFQRRAAGLTACQVFIPRKPN